MRIASVSLLFVFGAAPDGGLSAISAKPPSSLEPEPVTAIVRFAYVHRIVRECSARGWGPERLCAERVEPASAQTQFELFPLRDASLDGRKDARISIRVGVSSSESAATTIELTPGLWELRWPGHEHNERFTVNRGDSVDVDLRSIAGRCEVMTDGNCNLLRNVMRRRVGISFHRRESQG